MIETLSIPRPNETSNAFVPEIPTVIVAGSTSCKQSELDWLQQLPINLIVLNHALSRFQWEPDRVIWSVYDEPKNFPDCLPLASKTRQIIVPEYKAEPWTFIANCNVLPIPYGYQNIMGWNVEPFQFQGTTKGHANCLCSALAHVLRNSNQPVYLYDIELPVQYILARKTIEFWAKDKNIANRLFIMNPSSSLKQTLRTVSLDSLSKGLE